MDAMSNTQSSEPVDRVQAGPGTAPTA